MSVTNLQSRVQELGDKNRFLLMTLDNSNSNGGSSKASSVHIDDMQGERSETAWPESTTSMALHPPEPDSVVEVSSKDGSSVCKETLEENTGLNDQTRERLGNKTDEKDSFPGISFVSGCEQEICVILWETS